MNLCFVHSEHCLCCEAGRIFRIEPKLDSQTSDPRDDPKQVDENGWVLPHYAINFQTYLCDQINFMGVRDLTNNRTCKKNIYIYSSISLYIIFDL